MAHLPCSSAREDGRYVVFMSSTTNLVDGDTNGYSDIFVKDMVTGDTRRVSVSQSGREATDPFDESGSHSPSISPDGRYVVFTSDMRDLIDGSIADDNYNMFSTGNPLAFQSSVPRLQWVDVSTRDEALLAQGTLKNYLSQISTAEGQLGSSLSRFQVAANNLLIARENYDAASSQIVDVDVAAETAVLLQTKIIQQAAAAILAQAQQGPALALELLE